MGNRLYLNDNWKFSEQFDEAMLDVNYDTSVMKDVRVPHTVKETPLHYFDEHDYQMVSGYMRTLDIPKEWEGKSVRLTIEGAAHNSEIFVNGNKLGEHSCGYTAYTVDISDALNYGESNMLVVKVDSREQQNIPPFGFVVDYMTYGGIYRDVYLEVTEKSYISDVFVTTKLAKRYEDLQGSLRCEKSQLISKITIENATPGMTILQSVEMPAGMATNQGDGNPVGVEMEPGSETSKDPVENQDTDTPIDPVENQDADTPANSFGATKVLGLEEYVVSADDIVDGKCEITLNRLTGDVALWDIDNPVLYKVTTAIVNEEKIIDTSVIKYGYRKAVFKKDGFYLNGRKVKIRGLNRHQSYAFVGYAMPESMQKLDADILKYELGLNAVRTSHYPQSHYFLDRCDELGLLVFTEIPGWQHIGDEEWKKQAVKNTEDMIIQYRNHVSIILWGVRINESVDDDAFYTRTNEVAHRLDPSRPTGGVRCYKKSNLLEDVYTYNDFVHTGKNQGCDKKSAVTSDNDKPYLISEYMGHMYPTKAFDCEEHRVEHAIRHANVLESVNANTDIAGSFGWCMFDYNTHKDFGSGDRICYHGIMDMFRNPKLAAAVYASHQENTPVLELSSSMDIGEHPGCNRGETYVFTNADSVKMYKNDHFIKEFTHENSDHKNLKNAPIKIDDYIGDLLETKEGMPHRQAEEVKSILNEVAKFGLYNMSKAAYLKAGKMMVMYHMTMDDAVKLYNKYIGDWGGESTIYRFEAIKDGEVVKTLTKAPMTNVSLKVTVDHTNLVEKNSYDVAAVRIEAVDEYGNRLPFYNDPITFDAKGSVGLIGPSVAAMSGGMAGTYVKTKGKNGKGKLVIRLQNGVEEVVEFEVAK